MSRRISVCCVLFTCLAFGAPAHAITTSNVYLAVVFDEFELLNAAEFRVEHLPYDFCDITEHWYADDWEGDIATGIFFSFAEAQAGPVVCLGYLSFTAFEDVGDDYRIWVQAAGGGGLVVYDQDWEPWPAEGGQHTFNCSGNCPCEYIPTRESSFIGLYADEDVWETCDQPLQPETPVDHDTRGAVKHLY